LQSTGAALKVTAAAVISWPKGQERQRCQARI